MMARRHLSRHSKGPIVKSIFVNPIFGEGYRARPGGFVVVIAACGHCSQGVSRKHIVRGISDERKNS